MNDSSLKILFATSEIYPFIKTGGLADVSSGLPLALKKLGHDVRIIMPAYKTAMENVGKIKIRSRKIKGFSGRLLAGYLPDSQVPIWFVDIPELFHRKGGPYGAFNGADWPDNSERFNTFNKVISKIGLNQFDLNWKPDLVHCNDWQTGLAPAYLSNKPNRPATVFTIHNIAYTGLFSRRHFEYLNLPEEWWDWDKLEFHDKFSFLKGGLVFADKINTVSPTYAKQILTPEFAYGMEGLLNHRLDSLSGILNGIDDQYWNPALDKRITKNYNFDNISDKAENKLALQKHFNLEANKNIPLIGIIGRVVEQKGFDLLQHILPTLMQQNLQLVMLGSGDKKLEANLKENASQHPDKFSVQIGYDENLAHLIEAGADMFLMPSRFEPCGLNQFYSLKYGTVPIVHNTGGLADSVVDCNEESLANNTATGFKFYNPTAADLQQAILRALENYAQPQLWRSIVQNGMQQDFSWTSSAQHYLDLYHNAIKSQGSQDGD